MSLLPTSEPVPEPIGGEVLQEYMFSDNANFNYDSAGQTLTNSTWDFVHPGEEYGDVIVECFATFTPLILGSSSNWWIGLYRNGGATELSRPILSGSNGTATNRKGFSIYWAGLYSPGETVDFRLIGDSFSASDARLEPFDWGVRYSVKRPATLGTTITDMAAA